MGGFRRIYGVHGTPTDGTKPHLAPDTSASLRVTNASRRTNTYYFDQIDQSESKGAWTDVRVAMRSHPSSRMRICALMSGAAKTTV